jgi:RNA polymerase sigma-70 factor (ECF subfamily)
VTETPARTDADLVAAARQGDREAVEELVRRYQPLVYRYGVRMCGDADAAGDVLQDTLLSLARSVPTFRGESSLSTWLYTVARHACLRQRRRRKFQPARQESLEALSRADLNQLAEPGGNPEQLLARRETRAALDAALAALKPADREVLVLRDVEGLTAPEVGKVLGVSVAAVKSRLHRARGAVRAAIGPALTPLEAFAEGADCPDVVRMFSRHLEGDLSASTCADMMAHLDRCPRCREACDSLRRVLALCRESPPAAAPPAPVGAAVRDAIKIFLTSPSPARRGSSSSPRGRS